MTSLFKMVLTLNSTPLIIISKLQPTCPIVTIHTIPTMDSNIPMELSTRINCNILFKATIFTQLLPMHHSTQYITKVEMEDKEDSTSSKEEWLTKIDKEMESEMVKKGE
jgi:hypothetical protein